MAISLATPSNQPPLDPKLARLISDPFLSELYAKAYEYFIGAHEGFKDERGNRFGKDIVHSDVWHAIIGLREAHCLKEYNKDKPELWPDPESTRKYSDFLSKNLDKALSEGELGWIEDLLKLARIYFKARPPGEIPWHYYVGLAAWELLFVVQLHGGGRIPTKMDVKQRAIAKRKKSEAGKYKAPQRWDRIFSALGLDDLPTAQGGRHST